MNLTQLISILRAQSKTALTIFAVVVGAVLLASLLMPKKYLASTQVVIDLKPDPVNGGLPSGMMVRPYLKTQADIIGSERLLLMIVDRFNLNKQPTYTSGLSDDAPVSSARQYAADSLARNLKVEPGRESTILTISYKSEDPQIAADMANAFARAYIDTNIEMRTKPASQRRDWFIQQGNELRVKLEASQKRLSDFQRENNIVSTDESRDVSTQRLESLSSSFTSVSSDASDLNQRVVDAQSAVEADTLETIPEIINNPVIQQLKAEQSRLRAAYGQQLAVYGKNHPQMRSLGSELWTVGNRIKAESLTVVASLEKARDAAISKRDRIKAELSDHQNGVLSAKTGREDLALLQRDVDNIRQAYDGVQEQLNQSNLQSASTYANVFVLSPALAPNRAASPNLLINLIAAIVVATLLAIGLSVLLEMRSRRVHSREDMEQATGGPILGEISRSGVSRRPINKVMPQS